MFSCHFTIAQLYSSVSPILSLFNKWYFGLLCPVGSLNIATCSFQWHWLNALSFWWLELSDSHVSTIAYTNHHCHVCRLQFCLEAAREPFAVVKVS